MKIKLFKKDNSFKKKDFSFNANLYWKIALGLASVFIIFSAFFGYNLFNQINQESVVSVKGSTTQVPTVDKNRIEKDLNYFTDRETKSTSILNSPSPIVDPSL